MPVKKNKDTTKKIPLIITLLLLIIAFIFFAKGKNTYASLVLTLFWLALAFAMLRIQVLSKFVYTVIILAAVTVALGFPAYFVSVGSFPLKALIVPLLQIITFGVGCTMSWRDFLGVLKMPQAVLVGTCCHYIIMPLVAFSIARLFAFPPEIAAGVILVGCCPSGMASNVIAFIAKANLALSVTITALSTLLSPIMTPLLMKWLGGQFVVVSVSDMVMDIVKMVILPIIVGVLINHFFKRRLKWIDTVMPKISMAAVVLIIVVITAAGRDHLLQMGILLVLAMFLHMVIGAGLGYWGAKICGMEEVNCRTVAIEVGMQNGGLASGIAATMGKIATIGLAPAVNGPVMNTTFSLIATWWGKKTVPGTGH